MSSVRYMVGDVFERMAELPDHSVDLLVTSPPFLALRSYLPADHPDKAKEIGSEPTPAAFLSTLLRLTKEWRRLLTPYGSICVELGDTYSGSGGAGGDFGKPIEGVPATGGPGWPPSKSLCGIPDAYALSLEYGWNMLNPSERCERWRVRNKIVWHRPNPPVGALGDKVRPSTSYVTVACVSKDRWFDLDAERVQNERAPHTDNRGGHERNGVSGRTRQVMNPVDENGHRIQENAAGAPPLDCWIDTTDSDVWTIPTAPYAGSHYATFPPALPRRLINLMCPRSVCVSCGEPRRRIVSAPEYVPSATNRGGILKRDGERAAEGVNQWIGNGAEASVIRQVETLGWTDCGCVIPNNLRPDNWRRGLVLDPFGGSGTTGQAAAELGRDSILIDLDERNLELARQRCGMFLTEDEVPA